MANKNETVREVCAEMRDGEEGCYFPFTDNEIKVTKKVSNLLTAFADRILSAHNREMAAKDAEIARMKECVSKISKAITNDCYEGCGLFDECDKAECEGCYAMKLAKDAIGEVKE